ncbi:hypothetical protein K7V76_002013 [Vibrio fluvialis]|nr:hypothetical protein [Vibrio fluvialis]EKO3526486.1 hypothetical protein [Vibrio fluvialis]EKO3930003.1 hypothetical protein [Vibrio fluvialis]MBY7816209.1 hypothetical protein [Vibrio fluvialis]
MGKRGQPARRDIGRRAKRCGEYVARGGTGGRSEPCRERLARGRTRRRSAHYHHGQRCTGADIGSHAADTGRE